MLIFGTDRGAYRIELNYDGSLYHYTLKIGSRTLHHFFDEFDNEQAARLWAGQIAKEHLEQITNSVL